MLILGRITLYEGKYHQLRRMLAVVGNRAVEIKRVQVGPLKLGDLQVRAISNLFLFANIFRLVTGASWAKKK